MPINHSTSSRGITTEEFKEWLKQFDKDGDGRISQNELHEAIRRRGGWFTTPKASRTIHRADTDKSGYVKDAEIENLITVAQKELGIKISAW